MLVLAPKRMPETKKARVADLKRGAAAVVAWKWAMGQWVEIMAYGGSIRIEKIGLPLGDSSRVGSSKSLKSWLASSRLGQY